MTDLEVKVAVRERDGMRCTECGMTGENHVAVYGRGLEVHRTTPGSAYSTVPGVCVTLCRPCHTPKPKRERGTVHRIGRLIILDHDVHAQLKTAAADLGRTMTQLVRQSIIEGLAAKGYWPPS